MPIAKEYRKYYAQRWHRETRPRIMARAGDACECCGRRNRCFFWTLAGGAWWDENWQRWRAPGSLLVDLRPARDRGVFVEGPDIDQAISDRSAKFVLTQIGIAHINHIPGDDRDENLAALCRACHLNHDLVQHRNTRCVRKDSSRPLLTGLIQK